MELFDLIVIGSGPGGYVAALRAAKLGMKVACIEKEENFGGTCLRVGCIPSKSLLHSTEYFHRIKEEGEEHGIVYKGLSVDLAKMMERKEGVVSSLAKGITFLFKKNKVASFKGWARLLSSTRVEVGSEILEGTTILLATGSEPIPLPFAPFDEKKVLSSTGALALEKIPKKMLIVGAGIIGLELGSVYGRMGTEIEIVEILDHILPTFDADIRSSMLSILKKQNMRFHLQKKVTKILTEKKEVEVVLENEESLHADVVLVAIGRRPFTKNLGLEEIGIEIDQAGRIKVDGCFRTNKENVYAIGDVIDGPMLAHKASQEAIALVDYLAGNTSSVNFLTIPNVMYTWPEAAAVGMTEEEAKEHNLELKIGKVAFKGIARAKASGDEEGFVKVIGEKKSDRLIGMHILGPNASEMIHEGVIAMESKMTLTEIGRACHAHPTCSEAIKEAALHANQQEIH